ncbi:MAG: GNAT family N-acetyltransferase [candidate division Zixibacteria bacterium]|nr:GNAT family N-acetyltransferase [candidate division Zixibacteria bacterium]
MEISYRRCRHKDLLPSVKLVMTAINKLRKQSGMPLFRRRIREVPPLYEHLLRTDPKTFYCAWKGERLVGFCGAAVRGMQWYLAFLFVHPNLQDKGIGRKLLEKAWVDKPKMTHSLSTFAYNMQAVGLYSRFGLSPLCTIPLMKFPGGKLPEYKSTGLSAKSNLSEYELNWIINFEGKIRGYSRAVEYDYWRNINGYRITLFKRGRKKVGYSVSHKSGMVAPAGAISNDDLNRVVYESLYNVTPTKGNSIILFCPTHNTALYHMLIKLGFRNDEMLLFMSDKQYTDFQRYLPATLALF